MVSGVEADGAGVAVVCGSAAVGRRARARVGGLARARRKVRRACVVGVAILRKPKTFVAKPAAIAGSVAASAAVGLVVGAGVVSRSDAWRAGNRNRVLVGARAIVGAVAVAAAQVRPADGAVGGLVADAAALLTRAAPLRGAKPRGLVRCGRAARASPTA